MNKIYKKLGLELQPYSGEGGEHYKIFKRRRFQERLAICLAINYNEDCCKKLSQLKEQIKTLTPEELEKTIQAHSPRNILSIFVEWEKGEISFSTKDNEVKLVVKLKKSEYDFSGFARSHRKRCDKNAELNRVKNELCLRVLLELIQTGEISL